MVPLIGLNTTLMGMDDPLKAKAACHLKYIDAVIAAGGAPVIIPPYRDSAMLEAALAPLQGFCLIGGPDYHPAHYGGHSQPDAQLMHVRRHEFDLALAAALLEKTELPVLGVCGGHQLINIARGGALVQDLATEWAPEPGKACTLLHADDQRTGTAEAGNVYRHEVRTATGSRIARIAEAAKLLSNSYHHQAVDPRRVGRGLAATAWAPDGVIEALEGEGARFVLGVQWHPERQTDERQHLAIFQALVEASKRTD